MLSVSHSRHPPKGAYPDKKKTGPPVRGLGAGLITHHYITKWITETQTIDRSILGTHSQESRPPGGMRPLSQIRREARRRNIFSTRGPTRLVTWNVRTVYEQGWCANISKEMKEYNIDILGLCETSCIQAGQTRLSTGETIIYLGHEDSDAPHTQGVAVMMSEKSLIGWEPVSARQMVARFKTSHKRITLTGIMCYAPTNDVEEEETEEFYDRLCSIVFFNRGKKS